MKKYEIIPNSVMYESQLPKDLPETVYYMWYEMSKVVFGVRVGPYINEMENPK